MIVELDTYQNRALGMAVYPGQGSWVGLVYTMLGLGEVGELQGKAKKMMRDDHFVITEERRLAMAKELGDSLWYVAASARELGFTLSEIATENIEKLESRQERGVLQGSGDDR